MTASPSRGRRRRLKVTHSSILTPAEIEALGPPVPEELADTDLSTGFLCDLALKHVAECPEPTTELLARRMCLPRTLVEELLLHLCREKLVEIKMQAVAGSTRYGMLDRGWELVERARGVCGYSGPAPVSLADYSYLMKLQAVPPRAATIETVRAAFSDLVLPESLLRTMGCVVNSRRS